MTTQSTFQNESPTRKRSRRLVRGLAVGAATVLALGLAGCSADGSTDSSNSGDTDGSLEVVNVGVVPSASFVQIYIAIDKGFFEDEGLDVQPQDIQNAASIVPSILNGQLDFGAVAVSPFIAAVDKGLPLKAVANASNNVEEGTADNTGIMVAPDSGITRAKDLEGKVVAVNGLAALPHIAAEEAIRKDGGDPSKVTFVAIGFPDMGGALSQERVDAIAVVEPFFSAAANAGNVLVTELYAAAFNPGSTATLYITSDELIASNSDMVERFQKAIDKANDLAADDSALVEEILASYGGMNPDVLKDMDFPDFGSGIDAAGLTQISEVMVTHGYLDKALDGKSLIFNG